MGKKTDDKEQFRVVTTEARCSHPHLFKATQMILNGKPKGDKKYSIELLFDKSKTKLSQLKTPVMNAIKAKWGEDESEWPEKLKKPYRDGDKPHGKKKEVKKEHAGMWVVKASTKEEYGRPFVVGEDPDIALEEADVYPGCYVRASLFARPYETSDGFGVSFTLDGVQFVRKGPALSSKKPANQVFGVLEKQDDDDEVSESFDDMEDDEDQEDED